jgi:GNAT superfamily N-acetyltransferase
MEVQCPRSDAEFAQYYELRWQVLRQPWGEPRGSERDEFDLAPGAAEHALMLAEDGRALAVGRLHFNSPAEAQIRYMAVQESARGWGLGRRIVDYLEARAQQRGAQRIILNARDTAAGFYEKLGYRAVGDGPTLFGAVKHVRMEKTL